MPEPAPQLQAIAQAVEGLDYPSESDEPFDVLQWPGGPQSTAAQVLAAHAAPDRKLDRVPIDQFFSQLDASDAAARFRNLRRVLESHLRDLAVYRVGEGDVRVDVYLLGRLPNGDWAGLHTVSVET